MNGRACEREEELNTANKARASASDQITTLRSKALPRWRLSDEGGPAAAQRSVNGCEVYRRQRAEMRGSGQRSLAAGSGSLS